MSVPIPTDPSNPDLWVSLSTATGVPLEAQVVYFHQLYKQEKAIRVRNQQAANALAYLTKDQFYRPFFTCVDCNNSALVDGTKNARLLGCGHVMHTYCMSTYSSQKDGLPPLCPFPKCGLPFGPEQPNPENQIHHFIILTASRILKADKPEDEVKAVRQDLQDHPFGDITLMTPMLQNLTTSVLNPDTPYKTIADLCITICKQEQERLTRLATEIAHQITPGIQAPFVFPNPPQKQKPDTSKTVARKRGVEPEPAAAAPAAAKRPKPAAALPPGLQPDEMLPEGNAFAKCRIQNKTCIVTKYSGKCPTCTRPYTALRTVIVGMVGGTKGFECSLCGLNLTSAAVDEIRTMGEDCIVSERQEQQEQQHDADNLMEC